MKTLSKTVKTYHQRRIDIDQLDDAIVNLSARINASTYQLLLLIREFDERAGGLLKNHAVSPSGYENCTILVYTVLVLIIWYTCSVKNITLSAEEQLIAAAREKARRHSTSLNAEFRRWLKHYAANDTQGHERSRAYTELMSALSAVSSGGQRFTRDELNER